MRAADDALNDDSGRWQELRHWNLKHWAMEPPTKPSATFFLGEAVQVVHG
jgi:hypothetical protein